MTTPPTALLGGLVRWDHELDSLIDRVAVLDREIVPPYEGWRQTALARQRADAQCECAARFGKLQGWRWRPVRDFSVAMLAAGRARRRWQGDSYDGRYDLDHPDYYWSANSRRPAAVVVHNYCAVLPDLGPGLGTARRVYRLAEPAALAVLWLPRSWYLPTGTTAFLVVPAAHLRAAA